MLWCNAFSIISPSSATCRLDVYIEIDLDFYSRYRHASRTVFPFHYNAVWPDYRIVYADQQTAPQSAARLTPQLTFLEPLYCKNSRGGKTKEETQARRQNTFKHWTSKTEVLEKTMRAGGTRREYTPRKQDRAEGLSRCVARLAEEGQTKKDDR